MTDDIRFPNDAGIAERTAQAKRDLEDFEASIAQQPEAPVLTAAIITTGGESLGVQSIDLTDVGAFYVYYDGSTNLMPWHMIARVVFFDEPAELQPRVAFDLPERHEGSE